MKNVEHGPTVRVEVTEPVGTTPALQAQLNQILSGKPEVKAEVPSMGEVLAYPVDIRVVPWGDNMVVGVVTYRVLEV